MIEYIAELVRWVKRFFPAVKVVMPNEAGIKITKGAFRGILDVGWYIYWPLTTEIVVMDTTPQFLRTPCQSVMIGNGEVISLSITIEYTIEDPFKAYFLIQDYDTSLRDLSMGLAAQYISRSYDIPSMPSVSEWIVDGLEIVQKEWGLDIIRVFMPDYCTHRVIRIMNPQSATSVTGGVDD